MGIGGNFPALIWPLENLRRVVTVIDNCVWVECSVSADNDSPNQATESAVHHSSTGTLCSRYSQLLAGAQECVPKMPIMAQSSQLVCNYVALADNNLSSASTAGSFYS